MSQVDRPGFEPQNASVGPLRVTLVTPGFSADESDDCIPSLLHLVRELASRHRVEVLALRYPPTARRYCVHGASIRSLGGGERVGVARAILLARALAVLTLRRGPRPHVLHGLWADEPGFLAVLAGRLLRRPALVSLLGGELTSLPEIGYGHQLHRVPRGLVASSLARAHHVTAGSRFLAEAARPRVEPDRLSMFPWGVDTDRFSPEGPGAPAVPLAGGPALLNVASLSPVKDQTLLLEALAALRSDLPDACLHLVGAGPERSTLEARAAALGVAERVHFHGEVRHELLPPLYRGADLFVLSSRHESQCMAVLEAAACGTPTVGVAVGVVPELGAAARTVTGRDPRRFAEAVRSVATSPQTLAAMRRAGLEAIAERYALTRCVDRLTGLYRTLAALPSRPTSNRE